MVYHNLLSHHTDLKQVGDPKFSDLNDVTLSSENHDGIITQKSILISDKATWVIAIKPTTSPFSSHLIDQRNVIDETGYQPLYLNPSYLQFHIKPSSSEPGTSLNILSGIWYDATTCSYGIAKDKWNYIVLTKDSKTVNIYINGTRIASEVLNLTTIPDFSFPCALGCRCTAQSQLEANTWYNGAIKDFRVYDKALSEAEILELPYVRQTLTSSGNLTCMQFEEGFDITEFTSTNHILCNEIVEGSTSVMLSSELHVNEIIEE